MWRLSGLRRVNMMRTNDFWLFVRKLFLGLRERLEMFLGDFQPFCCVYRRH